MEIAPPKQPAKWIVEKCATCGIEMGEEWWRRIAYYARDTLPVRHIAALARHEYKYFHQSLLKCIRKSLRLFVARRQNQDAMNEICERRRNQSGRRQFFIWKSQTWDIIDMHLEQGTQMPYWILSCRRRPYFILHAALVSVQQQRNGWDVAHFIHIRVLLYIIPLHIVR